jgi:signal transduction histidine kinase
MDRLVEDALSLAKEPEVDDPAAVALGRVAAETWERQYAGADATLDVRLDPDRRLRADRACLERLVDNLLGNAVEHGGEDVTVWLEAVGVGPGDGPVEPGFAVADDGPGIDVDRRETVMEKGYTTSREGTGLGLAIVHDMAAVHGWTVEVTESAAGGARFVVRGVEWAD